MSAIHFFSETDFVLKEKELVLAWVRALVQEEGKMLGPLNYVFCDDAYLHQINLDHLKHDTYTDIIAFDYGEGQKISGDIFISTERVKENAEKYNNLFFDELCRVLAHGALHLCGYKDKTESDAKRMRGKENYYLSLRP